MQPGTAARQASSADLEGLMAGYQRGDVTATTDLISVLNPLLYRFFAAQPGARAEAEDLVQDVWLRLHKARHTYRPGEPVLPWIYAIARHVAVDAYRRSSRVASREIPADPMPEVAAPSSPGILVDLYRFLGELPQGQRDVVVLLRIAGLTIEEAARTMSLTAGAVKQKAHRAFRRLREISGGQNAQ
jgi:RNA polymerase sigma-70 factor (ECF subfamily)